MLEDREVGENLAALRGGVSQGFLAEQMRHRGFKWSQATVWAIEKGDRPLRVTEAAAAAEILGTQVEGFFGSKMDASIGRRLEVAGTLAEQLTTVAEQFCTAQQLLAVMLDVHQDEGKHRTQAQRLLGVTAGELAVDGMLSYYESAPPLEGVGDGWLSSYLVMMQEHVGGADGEHSEEA
ncbi:hypothetical protein RWH43_10630 [Microbacterium sp. KSW2-21]|uniref:Helix-turn-helix transcriptional regulator n=1 Tax=Microbacterium algihabitans TaxID=3075992 RepID=A0ABU3RWL7_9MICO|nr:hypothetical protein [Microbacterium sp. KSW2-21]MDU0327209.1 hypothetical protein [Microbacterium sp. KSW2-21]